MHPADEFAEISETIAQLTERRNALRAQFLNREVPLRSNRHEVLIRMQTRRTLDKARLPDAILRDPRYFKLLEGPVVTVRSLNGRAADDAGELDLIERD